MVGFGYIIGGIQVLLLGSLFLALRPKFANEQQAMHAGQQTERI
ncbi:hypothetical protein [Paenibacillus sp. UNC496MF]|nr:hypothetical protein [Paenibacillus sp. UNC496MF]